MPEMQHPANQFFWEMEQHFLKASLSDCEQHQLNFSIADHSFSIHLAGNNLYPVIFPALAHLTATLHHQPELEIYIWDQSSTGELAPEPGWDPASIKENAHLIIQNTPFCKISLAENRNLLQVSDAGFKKVFIGIKDARLLKNHFYAAPLMLLFKDWMSQLGFGLVHAGCVGNNNSAVLVVGMGGSGKSTSSLMAALAGMDYLSDDYTLVKFGEKPQAYSLYNSGKLHEFHLNRFPALAGIAVNPNPEPEEKPIIFLQQHFPQQIALQRNLKAIIAPVVTGKRDSKLVKIAAIDSMKALSVSTIYQLKNDDPYFLKKLAVLAASIPGYRLELGTDTNQIAPLLQHIVSGL